MVNIHFKLLATHSIKQRTVVILHGFNSNSSGGWLATIVRTN